MVGNREELSRVAREFSGDIYRKIGEEMSEAMRAHGVPEKMRDCSLIEYIDMRNMCMRGVMQEFWSSHDGIMLSRKMSEEIHDIYEMK